MRMAPCCRSPGSIVPACSVQGSSAPFLIMSSSISTALLRSVAQAAATTSPSAGRGWRSSCCVVMHELKRAVSRHCANPVDTFASHLPVVHPQRRSNESYRPIQDQGPHLHARRGGRPGPCPADRSHLHGLRRNQRLGRAGNGACARRNRACVPGVRYAPGHQQCGPDQYPVRDTPPPGLSAAAPGHALPGRHD